jgi:hypothetical protein
LRLEAEAPGITFPVGLHPGLEHLHPEDITTPSSQARRSGAVAGEGGSPAGAQALQPIIQDPVSRELGDHSRWAAVEATLEVLGVVRSHHGMDAEACGPEAEGRRLSPTLLRQPAQTRPSSLGFKPRAGGRHTTPPGLGMAPSMGCVPETAVSSSCGTGLLARQFQPPQRHRPQQLGRRRLHPQPWPLRHLL